jgi:hypothetical protein
VVGKKGLYRSQEKRYHEDRRCDGHNGQAHDHQSLAAGLLDQGQGHEGHAHVDAAHDEGGDLRGRLVQAGRQEDRGGVEHGLKGNIYEPK